jgi:hypothetical protein
MPSFDRLAELRERQRISPGGRAADLSEISGVRTKLRASAERWVVALGGCVKPKSGDTSLERRRKLPGEGSFRALSEWYSKRTIYEIIKCPPQPRRAGSPLRVEPCGPSKHEECGRIIRMQDDLE